jgi:S1-C subfamily serine protease
VLLAVDGVPIQASQVDDEDVFRELLRSRPVGEKADLTVIRTPDKRPRHISLRLEAEPCGDGNAARWVDSVHDLVVRDLCEWDRISRRCDGKTSGVLVVEVPPGGWAAVSHLAVGDLIERVGQTPVGSVADFRTAVGVRGREPLSLFVRRGVHTLFLEVPGESSAEEAR